MSVARNIKLWDKMSQKEKQDELRSHFKVTNKDIIDAGLMDEWTPPIEQCEFCGNERITLGFWTDYSGVLGDKVVSKIFWKGEYKGWNQPIAYEAEPCICPDSREFYKTLNKSKEAEKKKIQEALEIERINVWKRKLIERSELNQFSERYQFDTYKATSPSQEQAFKISKQYVDFFEEKIKSRDGTSYGKGLLYFGDVGTGKTHLAVSTLRGLTSKGVSTLAVSATELFNRLRNSFNDVTGMKFGEIMKIYTTIPVLLIDDLGKTKPSEWTVEQLFHIVDTRVNQNKPIFVTANYSGEQLIERLTAGSNEVTAKAIVSRLEAQSVKLNIIAMDYRTSHYV